MTDQDMVQNCVHTETDTNILTDLFKTKLLSRILILFHVGNGNIYISDNFYVNF